jgi:cell division protein FtsI/penicillin-binding protein 2
VVAGLAVAAVGLLARASQVMILDHDHWRQLARRQHERTITVPSPRGAIRSADGYVLAASEERLAIQVDTHLLTYPELFVTTTASILGRPADQIRTKIERGSRAVWLAQRVPRDTAMRIRAVAPTAVVLVPDAERVYPLGAIAAPILGFVGREELQTIGRAGLEHHYDTLLAGEPMRYLAVKDAVQRQLRLRQLDAGRAGFDLELTLEVRLQARCEGVVWGAMEKVGARAASAVVLEAATGRVLTLVSLPSFEPSAPGRSDRTSWRLRPVQDAFEPGSTIKPIVVAAALANRAVRTGERFDCRGRGVQVSGQWIRDHAEPGVYDLDRVVAMSSNVGVIELAQRLQPDALFNALCAFGFGQKTRVGCPGETKGLLPPPSRWSKLSRAMLAIGQELTVSPIQLAAAYAVLANGGWLPQPRLISRAGDGEMGVGERSGRAVRVMDEALASRIRSMLELVVSEGTGDQASVPGFRVAGKTGTAQRAVAGGFDDEHHVAWFAGFLPMPDPRYVIVVALEQPERDFWAASTAAPVFSDLATAVTEVLGLPATEPLETAGGGRT